MDLYVLGGIQRAERADAEQDWRLFERAVVGRVRPEAGAISARYRGGRPAWPWCR